MSRTQARPARRLPLLGVHLSVSGGLENAFAAGKDIGCDCLQIFVKNQRQWAAPPLSDKQVLAYQAAARDTRLAPVVAHASYLLNLASPAAANRKRSVAAMLDELARCETLGVSGLIFHPGAHMKDGPAKGIQRIARCLDEVHRRRGAATTRILLETTAGQGTAIGYRFEELADILAGCRNTDHLGICLDTCHLFAAGYDFRTLAGYETMVSQMESTFGIDRVCCIHTNDSKRECGSRVDRHEHIGKGKIGKAGFAHFVNDKRWASTPMILETPKGKDGRGTNLDKVNLKRLRSLVR